MSNLNATTSMDAWFNSGWSIRTSYVLSVVETPPPSPAEAGDFWEELRLEDYQEAIEDLAVAKQASEEYEATGIDDTIPYSEYRARRLGSDT